MSTRPTQEIDAADLAELRARISLPALIGRRVKLMRSGKLWTACCPFHGEKTPSFYVYDDHYHCFGCGAHGDAIDFVSKTQGVTFKEAVALLSSEAGMSITPAMVNADAVLPEKASPAPAPSEHLEFARSVFMEAKPAAGTLAEIYLRSRGCGLPRGGAIRFHPACPRERERLPAMLAAMTDPVANVFVGIHRTFLRPDGLGKIEYGKTKMMLGGAGVIRLAPDDEITLGLGICEGIETGLALMQRAGWGAIWACGSAGGIGKFPVLAGIEALTIFPDRDDSGTSLKNANQCAERWQSAGREVRIIWPPAGADWDDALGGEAT
jgi:hypothetical protein